MPRISAFYGIVILMFHDDHDPPHFHAMYAGRQGVFAISPFGVIRTNLPSRAERLMRQWARLHTDELALNWKRARDVANLVPIAPLP